jgi:protein-disulfide isomerase
MAWLTQPFTLVVAAVVLLLVIILGVVIAMTGGGGGGDAVTKLEKARQELPLDLTNAAKLGKDDAPLKLVMYEDFQCPFCLKYTADQEPTLVNEYVKTGKVQFEYQHFPGLGFESAQAANASQCAADQNKFWEYHSLLFLTEAKAGQLTTEKTNVGRFDAGKLKAFATDVGIPDQAKFDQCVDSTAHQDIVTQQQSRARSLGITGTPGFTINGTPLGQGAPSTLAEWRKLLDDAIAQVQKAGSASPGASASPAVATAAAGATPQPTATR